MPAGDHRRWRATGARLALAASLAIVLGVLPVATTSQDTAGPVPASASASLTMAASSDGPASSWSIRTWTTRNGLPNGTVYAMAETEDGYLWLATSPTLIRFDGRRFAPVDDTFPPLANRQVRALANAREGGLWMGTHDGVVFRTDGRQVLETLPVPSDVRLLSRIVAGGPGQLWVTSAAGIHDYHDGRWRQMTPNSPMAGPYFTDAGPDGTLWVGSQSGLFRGQGERLELVPVMPTGAWIRNVFVSRSGDVWVSTNDGMHVYSPRTGRLRTLRPSIPIGNVDSIAQAEDGTTWLAGGLGVFVLGQLRDEHGELAAPVSVVDASPQAEWLPQLLASRSGAIVVRTEGSGLRVITPQPFRVFGRADGLPDRRVHHVLGDGRGGLWIGAACAGLTRFGADRSFTTYHAPELGLRSNCVRSLMRERDGSLWIGQAQGNLTRVRADGQSQTWGLENGLPDTDIGPLFEDRRGRVWIGTQDGDLCVIGSDGAPRCPAVPTVRETVWSLAEDRHGALLVGQVGRVTRIDGDRITSIDAGVPFGPVRGLHVSSDGAVWMASFGGGLARWRDGRIARISPRQGLFDSALSTFLPDRDGHIWLLGNTGVFRTHASVLDAVADGRQALVEGVLYGPADGVPEGNGGHPNGFVDEKGFVLLATVDGLAMFDPDVHTVGPAQHVVLDQVTDHDHTVPVPANGVVGIEPGGGPVEFHFVAPNVASPEKVVVRYRLEGRDENWVTARSDFARYSALPPGRYTFSLMARNASGAWGEPIAAATIDVRAFWWQTWWARAFALLAAAGAMFGLVQLRLRAVKRRNRALSREILERAQFEELSHRHLLELAHVSRLATAGELTATLTHELGQPLTAISATAEASRIMLAAGAEQGEIDSALSEIAQQGQRAAQVVRGLRAFLRRDVTQREILDVNAEITEVVRLARSTLDAARVTLALDLAEGAVVAAGDRIPLQQVILNLVMNAVEAIRTANPPARIVRIRSTRLANGGARVTVADSGPGIPPADRARIFDRFHSTKPSGMGIGLSICRSIVEAHGGRVQVKNLPGAGAVFSFTVRDRRKHPRPGPSPAISSAPGPDATGHPPETP